MSDRVRVGVVGTSPYAAAMHLGNLKSHPRATIAAICGRSRERAEALAREFAIPQIFTDWRAMIDRGKLDALVVAGPDDLHYNVTMAALDAGLHVLCEKPLALTLSQATSMYELAKSAGVVNMVSLTYRWTPHFRHLRRLAADGFVGRLYHANFRMYSPVGRDTAYAWRFDARRANGALGDLGPHIIDTARGLCGEIVSVQAQLSTNIDRPGVEAANDTALLLVAFAGGARGSIHISAAAHTGARGQEQRIELHGEAGTLESEATFVGEQVRGLKVGQDQFQVIPVPDDLWEGADPADFLDVFRKQRVGARLFVEAILAGERPSPDFSDGLRIQQVIDAALRSHAEGRRIAIAP